MLSYHLCPKHSLYACTWPYLLAWDCQNIGARAIHCGVCPTCPGPRWALEELHACACPKVVVMPSYDICPKHSLCVCTRPYTLELSLVRVKTLGQGQYFVEDTPHVQDPLEHLVGCMCVFSNFVVSMPIHDLRPNHSLQACSRPYTLAWIPSEHWGNDNTLWRMPHMSKTPVSTRVGYFSTIVVVVPSHDPRHHNNNPCMY